MHSSILSSWTSRCVSFLTPYSHFFFPQVIHEEFLLGKSIQGGRVFLYPHLHFVLGFNNDQVSRGVGAVMGWEVLVVVNC